jgi:hypothetical protein
MICTRRWTPSMLYIEETQGIGDSLRVQIDTVSEKFRFQEMVLRWMLIAST